MSLDQDRRIALLEATLREVLRIDAASRAAKNGTIAIDDALDDGTGKGGRLLDEWLSIKHRAKALLGKGP